MLSGLFEIVLTLALVMAAAHPVGAFMADVFQNRKTFSSRSSVRSNGRSADSPDRRRSRTGMARVRHLDGPVRRRLPVWPLRALAPARLAAAQSAGFSGRAPDLAFNIAVSFITNANWQAYGGETTLSHLSQMVGLTPNNFLDSAAAIAIAVALIRALSRNESTTIGNFWVDITRATLYVLLPLALVVALAFAALGVPQTLSGSVEATTLEGAKQIIALGPVASQEAIKLIGDNGGGFFNANSAHPLENPSVWSNILQNWSQLVLPVGLVFAFGRMVGDPKQGRALLAAMAVVFLVVARRLLLVRDARQSGADRPRRRPCSREHGRQGRAISDRLGWRCSSTRRPARARVRRTPFSS